MKVLIIGNGFDVAHGLPTKYTDFLKICRFSKTESVFWFESIPQVSYRNLKNSEKELFESFVKALGRELYEEFQNNINNCFWIEHFVEKEKVIGGTWLNFEDEIKAVVESVIRDKNNSSFEVVERLTNKALDAHCNVHSFYQSKKTFKDLFKLIMLELKKLTRALEIYMDGFVATISIDKINLIEKLEVDNIISFNYTDTYTAIYDLTKECCFIHGEANKDKNIPCNIVLGFDDHYLDGVSVVPELVPFEKYCQRIVNRTDNKYFEWLESMKREDNIVYIYGHSLGPADGDVLKQFIQMENTSTVVYCLNEFDRAEKIKNLAVILGPDNLIKLTGGINPSIEFKLI